MGRNSTTLSKYKRTPKPFNFRRWCREVSMSEKARKLVQKKVETDPDFALKVAEHGYGKAPQSLALSGAEGGPVKVEIEIREGPDGAG